MTIKDSKNRKRLRLLLSFLITGGILGLSWKYLDSRLIKLVQNTNSSEQSILARLTNALPRYNQSYTSKIKPEQSSTTSRLDASLPNPELLTMDGSVTIVTLVMKLQRSYKYLVNPSITTTYGIPDGRPNGTNSGIQHLIDGKVLMAASSRSLEAKELKSGLIGVPIARDAIAIAVSINNPYKGGLTMRQLKDIFQGKITNWSQVGGPDLPIKVINRSPNSGTYTFFQEAVLSGQPFAPDSKNFQTVVQDETTPILRALGNNGIGYSTVTQIENQKTVRIIPINGISPQDADLVKNGTYPISRVIYLVVPRQTSPVVKEFAEFAQSSQGQKAVKETGFLPL